MAPEALAAGLTTYIVLLFSLSFHEAAHAWTASLMGDETARHEGRITLNPLKHIDPLGTVVIPLLQIFWGGIPFLGWAKPTPVEPRHFRAGLWQRAHVLVWGAGPASNLLLAILFTAALFVGLRLGAAESRPALALLTTGVRLSALNTGGATPREGSFNVNGLRSTFNNFLLDGLDNNAYGTSNQGFSNQVMQPPPDAVAEFKVVTNNMSAEYGRAGGATTT